jgi:hypothetical protein
MGDLFSASDMLLHHSEIRNGALQKQADPAPGKQGHYEVHAVEPTYVVKCRGQKTPPARRPREWAFVPSHPGRLGSVVGHAYLTHLHTPSSNAHGISKSPQTAIGGQKVDHEDFRHQKPERHRGVDQCRQPHVRAHHHQVRVPDRHDDNKTSSRQEPIGRRKAARRRFDPSPLTADVQCGGEASCG